MQALIDELMYEYAYFSYYFSVGQTEMIMSLALIATKRSPSTDGLDASWELKASAMSRGACMSIGVKKLYINLM